MTGGSGFVGSNLVDRLLLAGHQVTVVDNMFTGRKKNVQQWIGHPNFNLIIHDVIEPIMIEVDQIYHLACPASPPHYQVPTLTPTILLIPTYYRAYSNWLVYILPVFYYSITRSRRSRPVQRAH